MSFAKFTPAVLALLVGLAAVPGARPAQAQTETVIHTFTGSDGSTLTAGLTSDGAGNFYGTTLYGGATGRGTVFELSPNGGGGWNETVLYTFSNGTDGGYPRSGVVLDALGNVYGETNSGGIPGDCSSFLGCGVVYEITP